MPFVLETKVDRVAGDRVSASDVAPIIQTPTPQTTSIVPRMSVQSSQPFIPTRSDSRLEMHRNTNAPLETRNHAESDDTSQLHFQDEDRMDEGEDEGEDEYVQRKKRTLDLRLIYDDRMEEACIELMLKLMSANDVALSQLTARFDQLQSRLRQLEGAMQHPERPAEQTNHAGGTHSAQCHKHG